MSSNKLMIVDNNSEDRDIYFRVACSCTEQDHDCSLYFTEDDHGYIEMDINFPMWAGKLHWEDKWYQRFYRSLSWRLKTAIKILFIGRIDTNVNFLFDKDNVKAFKTAILITEKKLGKRNAS